MEAAWHLYVWGIYGALIEQVNQKISKTAHIKELNSEMDRLKAELVATRAKNGVYIPLDQYEQREQVRLNCLFNVHASPLKDMLMPKAVLPCKNHSHMSSPPKVLG